MPDGSVSFAAPMDGASAPTSVTITALGYHLGALRAHEDKLDHLRFGGEHQLTDPEKEKRREQRVENAWLRAADEVEAVEELILASQARTLADAAVQVMIANNRLATINDAEVDQDEPDTKSIIARIEAVERALWSVTKLCARVAELQLADVAGDFYL